MVILVGTTMAWGARTKAQTNPPQESVQHTISDRDLDLLRKDLRSKRKQLIAANLSLTDAESTKFWPIYDQNFVDSASVRLRFAEIGRAHV